MIMPTAGTILDMGRTLTHKKNVVEMSLSGLTTQRRSNGRYTIPPKLWVHISRPSNGCCF